MNILFITADQWRAECLGSSGHAHVKTPHLDSLAADGVSFLNHYAQAIPCGPSRACLYTGMYMQNHRSLLNGTPLDARHTNVALELRKAGYRPALFGYTDVSLDPRSLGENAHIPGGFEGVLPGMDPVVHLDSVGKPWLDSLRAKGYQVPDHASTLINSPVSGTEYEAKGKTFAPPEFKAEDSNTAFLVDETIRYLSDCQPNPWCVHLSILSPHPPYIAPEPYNSLHNADDMELPTKRDTPEEEAALHPWLEYYLNNQRGDGYTSGAVSSENLSLSDDELRQIKATYFGMMSEVDAQIGRLIDYLKQTGVYEETIIIFTSDHGDLLGDHWMLSKFSFHDSVFHVPLIIRAPGSKSDPIRGTSVDDFTEIVDLMPTILDMVGQEIPLQCDGRSLLPFCFGDTPEHWRQEYHAEFDLRAPYDFDEDIPFGLEINQCGVNIIRGERYKYVHFAGLPPLFFDLQTDLDEFMDLSGNPDFQKPMLEYAQKLLSWRMEHDDPSLTRLHLNDDGKVHKL